MFVWRIHLFGCQAYETGIHYETAWDSLMMLTKKIRHFPVFRRFILVVSLFMGSALVGNAQDAPTAGEMLQEALKAMQAKRYDDAIDSMYMYLGEVDESRAPRVLAISQDIRYKLGSILIAQNRLDEAASVLQEYVDIPLANHPRQAMKMLTMLHLKVREQLLLQMMVKVYKKMKFLKLL